MSYKEFEAFIGEMCQEDMVEDYWYDEGVLEAEEMLKKFSFKDWKLLQENIKNKPAKWQERVIYSFDGENSEQELEIILSIIHTSDKEVLLTCVDTLRSIMNVDMESEICLSPKLIEKIQAMADSEQIIVKKISNDFLKKLELQELKNCSKEERLLSLAEQIGDRIRYKAYSEAEACFVVNQLIKHDLLSFSYETREQILYVLSDAVTRYQLYDKVNLTGIFKIQDRLEEDLKEYVKELVKFTEE